MDLKSPFKRQSFIVTNISNQINAAKNLMGLSQENASNLLFSQINSKLNNISLNKTKNSNVNKPHKKNDIQTNSIAEDFSNEGDKLKSKKNVKISEFSQEISNDNKGNEKNRINSKIKKQFNSIIEINKDEISITDIVNFNAKLEEDEKDNFLSKINNLATEEKLSSNLKIITDTYKILCEKRDYLCKQIEKQYLRINDLTLDRDAYTNFLGKLNKEIEVVSKDFEKKIGSSKFKSSKTNKNISHSNKIIGKLNGIVSLRKNSIIHSDGSTYA